MPKNYFYVDFEGTDYCEVDKIKVIRYGVQKGDSAKIYYRTDKKSDLINCFCSRENIMEDSLELNKRLNDCLYNTLRTIKTCSKGINSDEKSFPSIFIGVNTNRSEKGKDDSGLYEMHYYQYTGHKDIAPIFFDDQDPCEAHLLISIVQYPEYLSGYIDLCIVTGLEYDGVESFINAVIN